MEGTEPETLGIITGSHGNQEAGNMVQMSSKPLHRFVRGEPKSLGIVMVIVGCAEILMGFNLASELGKTSYGLYIPFWQGALFLVCGNLSIYTEGHPSKKLVTVCLAMYVVSFFGIIVSFGYRIFCFAQFSILNRAFRDWTDRTWALYRVEQLYAVEGLLFASSLCVSVLLIFLFSVARLALKSTNTQVIIQSILQPHPPPPPPQSDTTSN